MLEPPRQSRLRRIATPLEEGNSSRFWMRSGVKLSCTGLEYFQIKSF